MRYSLFIVPAVLFSAGFSCREGDSLPGERTFGEPKLAFSLDRREINESSGVARSHLDPGTYFTHNDSGDTARFWKFDMTGKVSGPYVLQGAGAVDWEDMASAKIGGISELYLGDIGDNRGARKSVQVYAVKEPTGAASEITDFETYDLQYPDGPHNAETLLVNPKSGEFTIVTKTAKGPSRVFTLTGISKPGRYSLKEVGSVEVGGGLDAARLITGGDYSEDGTHVVLRTYLGAYEYDVPADGAWWKSKPRTIKTAPEIQGEAIAYSLDGKQFVTTSEFAPCPVTVIPIAHP